MKRFHERFDIAIDLSAAKQKFINRCFNSIFGDFYRGLFLDIRKRVFFDIIFYLGLDHSVNYTFRSLIKNDFIRCLEVLEALYICVDKNYKPEFSEILNVILAMSELDLGIVWEKGYFRKKGADELDEKLVNNSLKWLRDKNYKSVLLPFEKGLQGLLKSVNNSNMLPNVITDMYQAVEALSKIVTERPTKDLSANRDLFLKKINGSIAYKKILKEYIIYANNFRHAIEEGKKKPDLDYNACESFVYLTGVFIRLVTNQNNST